MCVCVRACMCVCARVYVRMCVRAYVCVCVRLYVCACVPACIHIRTIHIHACIHTYNMCGYTQAATCMYMYDVCIHSNQPQLK